MKNLKEFLFFILIVFCLHGCKDEPTTPLKSNYEILTTTGWQIQKVYDLSSIPGQSIEITNNFPFTFLRFNTDGKYSSTLQSGSWEFDNEEKKIIFDKNTTSQIIAEVLELTTEKLQIKMLIPFNDLPVLCDITFTSFEFNTSPKLNFETLWKEFDQRYSFFEVKRINWDSLYSFYYPQITDKTTDNELFQITSSLLAHLKDGHVSLKSPFAQYYYTGWYTPYPENFPGMQIITKYFSADFGTKAEGFIHFAKIQDSIGYIYVGSNLFGNSDNWSQAIDEIIDSLKGMKGIIVDIRNNGGGNDGLGNIIAGRFADKQRVYSYVRWRNGQNHNDFTDFSPAHITPQGKQQFLKPVTFLTNRRCFSSAEGTTLMFRVLPNVTIIGDTTGGGSANPIDLVLPNGWTYRVSRWIQYTAEKEIFEGKGLAPDIAVWITEKDKDNGRDTILEYALNFLGKTK